MENFVKTTEELVKEYQHGNGVAFDGIVKNMDRMVKQLANKGVNGMSFKEVYSELLETLWKCCKDYNGSGKLTTMFFTYGNNKLRELREMMMHDVRKANTYASSFEQMQDDTGFDISHSDDGFDNIEVATLIESLGLTDNERMCLEILMNGQYESKKDVANRMGVDPSAVNYFQKSIARKLTAELKNPRVCII